MTTTESAPTAPPYGVAAAVAALILLLYVLTVAPTTQCWDTSEYIAAAKVLGIPHPPGNPLFVLLANVWGQIPLVAHYALRINLFAAVTSALASGLLFLVAERFLRTILHEVRWARYAAALAGVLVGAASFTVWNQSVVNEKVYTLSLFSIALVLWLTVRWADEPAGEHSDRWLVLIAYLLGLTVTNHMMGLLVGPAVLVYVLYTDPGVLRRWRMWVAVVVAVAVGLSVFVYLPIRAGHYPAINEGEPTTWDTLWAVLNREQYRKPPVVERQADLVWQYAQYFQYFGWQFARDWGEHARNLAAVLFGALGPLGAVRHWQRDRRGAVAMTALMVTVTVLLVFYLNFKYGYSIRPGENLAREVRERDYFFVASFQLWGVWVALGFGTVLAFIARALAPHLDYSARWYAAVPILLLAVIPVWGNRLSASRQSETLPRDFAIDLLQSVEPYGVLITAGDNDTFPLWYAQEVEGVRQDVTVANLSLMNTLWHNRQIKRRDTIPFDESQAIALYRGRSWPRPQYPVLSLTYEQINALPGLYRIRERSIFSAGNLRATITPRILDRAGRVTLQLITDNLGKRPIYFSRTVGGYADDLGLGPYLLGQGIARKLMPDAIQETDNIVRVRGLGWVDVERTRTLLFDIYHRESAARERPKGWIDAPSQGILQLYGIVYAQFADYLSKSAQEPDDEAARLAGEAATLARRILAQTAR
jgi:hypothetical protein